MPDGVQELNYNFWTALTRRSCVGKIEKCFNNLKLHESSTFKMLGIDTTEHSWIYFDRTDTGACVALQTLPFGMEQTDQIDKTPGIFRFGPVFMNCKELNYFACENEGGADKYINQTELVVSYRKENLSFRVPEDLYLFRFF